jgi:hypothetical protein
MVPADQGLGADQPDAPLNLRLIVEHELVGLDRLAQVFSSAARALTAACKAGAKKRMVLRPAALA